MRDAARAVAHAADLNDHIDGRGDLLANGSGRKVCAAKTDHVFKTHDRFARPVGVDGGKRSVMAGVHGLQHVDRFAAARFTDDDAVRTHT